MQPHGLNAMKLQFCKVHQCIKHTVFQLKNKTMSHNKLNHLKQIPSAQQMSVA